MLTVINQLAFGTVVACARGDWYRAVSVAQIKWSASYCARVKAIV